MSPSQLLLLSVKDTLTLMYYSVKTQTFQAADQFTLFAMHFAELVKFNLNIALFSVNKECSIKIWQTVQHKKVNKLRRNAKPLIL